MLLLLFLSENVSPAALLGGVNGPADLDVALDRALWGAWAALCSVGGHARAGEGTSTGGFEEFKERLKSKREQGVGDVAITTHLC